MKKRVLTALLLTLVILASACATTVPPGRLEPYSSGEIGERLSAGYMPEIVPRDDYGEIYPYIGTYVQGHEFGMSDAIIKYGFAALDGTVICDAVFNSVERYRIPDGSFAGTAVYLARIDNVRTGDYYAELEKPWTVYLIANNGSYVYKYDDAVFVGDTEYTPGDSNSYFSVFADGKWGVVDARGTVIIPPENGSDYPMFVSDTFSNPLFIKARVAQEIGERWNPGDEIYYSYVNLDGETVIGEERLYFPSVIEYYGQGTVQQFMLQCLSFKDGRAAKFTTDGYYGYIGEDGKWAIPPAYNIGEYLFYSYVPQFKDGVCIVTKIADLSDEGNTTDFLVIDTDGNELLRDGSFIMRVDDYFQTYDTEKDTPVYYDLHGDMVPLPEEDSIVFGNYLMYEWFSFIRGEDSDKTRDYYHLGKFAFSIPYSEYISEDALSHEAILIYDYDTHITQLYDNNGELLFITDDINLGIRKDPNAEGNYIISRHIVTPGLYYDNYEYLYGITDSFDDASQLETKYEALEAFNGYFAVRSGRFGGLLDPEGNWIVRVSLLDSLDD